MTAGTRLLYGAELDPFFRILKKRTVLTLVVQGAGLLGMAVLLLAASWVTSEWVFALLGLLVVAIGIAPLSEARSLGQHMENIVVTTEGIRLPIPLRRLESSSLLARQRIARVDLQRHPNAPRVLFFLSGTPAVRPVTLEKEFIFDWPGFVRALATLGVAGADLPLIPRDGPTSQELENPQAVRRLRSIFAGVGILAGVLLSIGYVATSQRLLGVALAALLVAFLVIYLLYRTRTDVIGISLRNGLLIVRTLLGSTEYPLRNAQVFAGAERVTIVDRHGRIHQFTSIDSEIASELSHLVQEHGVAAR